MLEGKHRINAALDLATAECRTEVLTVQPGGDRGEDRLREGLERGLLVVDRGVGMRTLYQHTVRHSQGTLAYAERMAEGKVEIRTLEELIARLIVFDRTVAFIPASNDDQIALELRHPGLVEYLITVFEQLWNRASPLLGALPYDPAPKGISGVQRSIAQLLVEGHVDDSIAHAARHERPHLPSSRRQAVRRAGQHQPRPARIPDRPVRNPRSGFLTGPTPEDPHPRAGGAAAQRGRSVAAPSDPPGEFPAPPTGQPWPEDYASTTVILLHCRKWGSRMGRDEDTPAHAHGDRHLCDAAVTVYTEALRTGRIPRTALRPAPCLLELALVHPDPQDDQWIRPVPPSAALAHLLQPVIREIHERIRLSAALADSLAPLASVASTDPNLSITVLEGIPLIETAIQNALEGAQEEILTLQPGSSRPADQLRKALERALSTVGRGATLRHIYQHPARYSPTLKTYLAEVPPGHIQVRTIEQTVERLFIFDRTVAFIPANPRRDVALEIRHPALVRYLIQVYEVLWAQATPLTEPLQ